MSKNEEVIQYTNKYGDVYTKRDLQLTDDKKHNVQYWEVIDSIAFNAVKDIAEAGGVTIVELGNENIYKSIVDMLVNEIEERFNIKYPFINENY